MAPPKTGGISHLIFINYCVQQSVVKYILNWLQNGQVLAEGKASKRFKSGVRRRRMSSTFWSVSQRSIRLKNGRF